MNDTHKELVMTEGSPAQMILSAVNKDMDLDKLKGLLELQFNWDANEAKKAYHVAMAQFKANPPQIIKDKEVSFGAGKTAYKHASLHNVTKAINEALSEHGLSASWRTAQKETISVTCVITHIMGHSEETTLSAEADTSGSKNSIQAIGSTITYLERYSLLAMTGLATQDQDDDGVTTEEEYITEEQLSIILDHIDNKSVNKERFFKHFKIESVDKMFKSKYNEAIKLLEAKK